MAVERHLPRTPTEIVYAVMSIVAEALRDPVGGALAEFYGAGWRGHLPRNVRLRDGAVQWDPAAVLHTIRHAWRDVFQPRFGEDGKHFAGELIGARNRAAHPNPTEVVTADDAGRAIDTGRRLLRALKVDPDPRLDALAVGLQPAAPMRGSLAAPRPRPDALGAATYEASRLAFRAEVIEPLRDDEFFRVVTPDGTFAMTKGEFYRVFANVVQSRSYRERGLYHYPTVPAKAMPFHGSRSASTRGTHHVPAGTLRTDAV